jgi:hypothetical protein
MKKTLGALMPHDPFLRCLMLSALVLRTGVAQVLPPSPVSQPRLIAQNGRMHPFSSEAERQAEARRSADFKNQLEGEKANAEVNRKLKLYEQILKDHPTIEPAVAAAMVGVNVPLPVAPVFGQFPEPPALLVPVAHPPVHATTPESIKADTERTSASC